MTEKKVGTTVFCGNVTLKLGIIISESESAITSIYHWIGAMNENFSELIIEFQLATNPRVPRGKDDWLCIQNENIFSTRHRVVPYGSWNSGSWTFLSVFPYSSWTTFVAKNLSSRSSCTIPQRLERVLSISHTLLMYLERICIFENMWSCLF